MTTADYVPDRWALIKITHKDHGTVLKVFATWSGGYAAADCWKLNSGIIAVNRGDGGFLVTGYSGSTYFLRDNGEGVVIPMRGVLDHIIEQMEGAGAEVQFLEVKDLENFDLADYS